MLNFSGESKKSILTGRAGRALRRLRSVSQKKYSRKFQVNQKYRHTTKRNKKINSTPQLFVHCLLVSHAASSHKEEKKMEEKDNEKVIIISAKDLIKEKCIISYIKSLTAGDMVSLVIEDQDRKLTDNMLLAIASSDRIENLEIKGNFRYNVLTVLPTANQW